MAPPEHIVVVTGSDPKLIVDYTAFRAVQEMTGIGFTRLDKATFKQFSDHMRRLRMSGDTMPDLHFAMHMSSDGAQFADALISPEQLSRTLSRVKVLFLAGCENIAIGDQLGLVPAVVTLIEKIEHDDARAFTELFWMARARGYEPRDAYKIALEPLGDIGEYAYLHIHSDFLAPKTAG